MVTVKLQHYKVVYDTKTRENMFGYHKTLDWEILKRSRIPQCMASQYSRAMLFITRYSVPIERPRIRRVIIDEKVAAIYENLKPIW